jgi:large subunit ribosomal protein L24
MLKLKVGDKVKVKAGKDKGREGVVEKVLSKKGKVVLPNLNVYKKHVKGTPGQKGGIYEVPRPLAISKVALVCPKCNKVTRVGFKKVGEEKVRVCRKCGREIDTKAGKKKKK